jgi:hypothetical protein
MPRVAPLPYEEMEPEIQAIVQASDEALGGSEWIQYFCHPAELYKQFVKFYYSRIMTDGNGLSVKLATRALFEGEPCMPRRGYKA